jgi:hypothetical protein
METKTTLSSLDVMNYPSFYFSKNIFNISALKKVYNLDVNEMTELLHRTRQQVHHIFKAKQYKPRTPDIKQILTILVEIYTLLRAILKDPETKEEELNLQEKIVQWFRIPNPVFDGKSPFQIVAEGNGKEVVLSLKNELHGAFS